jgi:hypothetical protein
MSCQRQSQLMRMASSHRQCSYSNAAQYTCMLYGEFRMKYIGRGVWTAPRPRAAGAQVVGQGAVRHDVRRDDELAHFDRHSHDLRPPPHNPEPEPAGGRSTGESRPTLLGVDPYHGIEPERGFRPLQGMISREGSWWCVVWVLFVFVPPSLGWRCSSLSEPPTQLPPPPHTARAGKHSPRVLCSSSRMHARLIDGSLKYLEVIIE